MQKSKKEKHRRAAEFSKAGLEVLLPHMDQPCEKRDDESASSESEHELDETHSRQNLYKNNQVQSMLEQREVLNDAAFSLHSTQSMNNGSPAASADENVLSKNGGTSLREEKIILVNDDVKGTSSTVCLIMFY